MSFDKNLRKYRELAGYAQAKDFADVLGIKYTTYTAYENQGREPKFDVLIKMAGLLNVTTDELLGVKENKLQKYKKFCNLAGIKVKFLPEYAIRTIDEQGRLISTTEKNGVELNFKYHGCGFVCSEESFMHTMDSVIDKFNDQTRGIRYDKIILAFLPIEKNPEVPVLES